jgi:pyruvate/2-oxoglutarate/acetoin dehydrogenase E1 component
MTKNISVSEAIRTALAEEMRRDPNVFMIGEDIGKFGGCFGVTTGLWDEFSDRIYETPIVEFAPALACQGAAALGKRPVFELMFGDFLGYCYSSVCLDAPKFYYVTGGKLKQPITYRVAQGGFISSGAHHSQCIEGWVNNHPGLYMVAPSTPADYYGLLKTAIRNDNPVLYLEEKIQYAKKGDVPVGSDFVVPLGKADKVKEGKDITILAWQMMRDVVEKLIPDLEAEGVSVELIDPRSLIPLDTDMLYDSVKKTGRLLIVHQHVKSGGLGESIAANVMKDLWGDLKKPVSVMGMDSRPIPAGAIEAVLYPNAATIKAEVLEMMKA